MDGIQYSWWWPEMSTTRTLSMIIIIISGVEHNRWAGSYIGPWNWAYSIYPSPIDTTQPGTVARLLASFSFHRPKPVPTGHAGIDLRSSHAATYNIIPLSATGAVPMNGCGRKKILQLSGPFNPTENKWVNKCAWTEKINNSTINNKNISTECVDLPVCQQGTGSQPLELIHTLNGTHFHATHSHGLLKIN